MKVAIIGSRSIDENAYQKLCELVPVGASEIISGSASGAHLLAHRYAMDHRLRLTVFETEYGKYGKDAPCVRNEQIIAYADYVIAVWDGKSRGTGSAINACIKQYTPVRVLMWRDGAPLQLLF